MLNVFLFQHPCEATHQGKRDQINPHHLLHMVNCMESIAVEEINHQIALLIELIIEEKVFMMMKKVSVLVEEHLYQEYNLHTHEEVTREEEVHLQEDMNQEEKVTTMVVFR